MNHHIICRNVIGPFLVTSELVIFFYVPFFLMSRPKSFALHFYQTNMIIGIHKKNAVYTRIIHCLYHKYTRTKKKKNYQIIPKNFMSNAIEKSIYNIVSFFCVLIYLTEAISLILRRRQSK